MSAVWKGMPKTHFIEALPTSGLVAIKGTSFPSRTSKRGYYHGLQVLVCIQRRHYLLK